MKTHAVINKMLHGMLAFLIVCFGIIVPEVDNGSSAYAQAEMEAVSSMQASQQAMAQPQATGDAEQLLNKYFRRIDAYIKQNQYRMAKNELKKIYLIDPSNAKAKNYEALISRSHDQMLREKESLKAQHEALIDAEQNLKEKRQVSAAFDRMKDYRAEEAWKTEGTYYRPGEVDLEEFERLQSMGIDRYKMEIITEAEKYLLQENYDKAISRYKDALAVDPGDLLIKELLNAAEEAREEKLDDIYKVSEEVEDREFMQEVTKSAMGIEQFRRGMKGYGYAKPHVGPKPEILPAIYDKLQIPVTADFRDVDLVSVLNFLSDYTGINIITSNMVSSETRPITVRFKELPLERALSFIIKGQGLSYRIEDDLIWVATIEEMENEALETRIYYLEKGSGVFTTFSSSNMGSLGSTGGSASVAGSRSIKELIEEAVPFPAGAKIVFDPRTGALIVTNTPTNLKRIEEILYTVDEPPQQILIESRFIEINMEEWENLGAEFDVNFAEWSHKQGGRKNSIQLDPAFDFTGVADAISSDTGGVNLTFGGLISDYQYNFIINAVKRMEKSKTLSAPKITTINNQTATIKVVTEEVFPTRFEVSLIQQDLNGDGDLDDAGETEFANVPQEFVSRDIGIILQVTPSVGIDKKTITLSIIPEVSSVSATPAKFTITDFDDTGDEVNRGSGTPNLPRFSTSTLSTTVVLESGQTAVLGGLIKETRGVTEEKVPVLGDIPYLGFFFRSKQDQIDRTNLIIFINGRVIR